MSSANPLTSRFLAFRAKRKTANGGTITLAAVAVMEQMDLRAAKVVGSDLIKERRAAMDDDITNTGDEIRAEVSQFESRDDVAPVWGFSLAGDYMLSRAERAQLAKEYTPKPRVAQTVINVQVTDEGDEPLPPDFVPAPVEPYKGYIDKTIDSEIGEFARNWAEFELMVKREASKLLLMG